MKKFKIVVSKNQKKYTIVLNSDNEKTAKERAHKDGYSILSIEDVSGLKFEGEKFYFEAEKDGELKKGKVVGKDIFKIYLKLRRDLDYNVKYLYSELDENLDEYGKTKIINELEAEYNIYSKANKFDNIDKEIKSQEKKEKGEFDNFYMKKELEETYNLINFVLSKIQNTIENKDKYNINLEELEKIKQIYNSIIKLKKSTNTTRIKEIGELSLLKIGKIELRNIEINKDKESRKLLGETNKLLKKIGSKRQFIEKSKDVKYIILNFISKISVFFNSSKKQKQEHKKIKIIDKDSYSYLKTVVLLGKYKKRLKKNNLNIIKNIIPVLFPFGKNREIKDNIFIKRKVIKQNINLLEAKKSGKIYSYTRVMKGYKKFVESILVFFSYIKNFVFILVLFYSIVFLLFINSSYYSLYSVSFNYNGLFYFIILMFIYFVIILSRGIFSLTFNFIILFIVSVFGIINF